ncbi:hypothetical protein PG993_002618 [Apiospora rasikravindrae]|uniref:Uncharacterized protein n=1 Tax=Apiospora rasikravindrae TaxID=990691 RepID=A0ABR1TXE1_9PEZI
MGSSWDLVTRDYTAVVGSPTIYLLMTTLLLEIFPLFMSLWIIRHLQARPMGQRRKDGFGMGSLFRGKGHKNRSGSDISSGCEALDGSRREMISPGLA